MSAPSKEAIEAVELDIVESMIDADRDFRNSLTPEEMRTEPDLSPGHTQAMQLINHPGWDRIKADQELLDRFGHLANVEDKDYFEAFYLLVKGEEATSWLEIDQLLSFEQSVTSVTSQSRLENLRQAMVNAIVAGMDAEKDNEGQIILYTGLVQTDDGGYELYEPDL